MDESIKAVREGALRAFVDGQWIVANPNDPMFSTVSMFATEYFVDGRWQEIEVPTEESLR